MVESSGAFLVQVKGERETVTIRAEKQLSYPDGSTRLLNVKVTSVRQGKTFVATGEEARVGENQTNLDMKGNVAHDVERRSRGDGRTAPRTARARGSCARPGPVTFKRGRMSGSGVDFSYDENARPDRIVRSDAKVKLAPDERKERRRDRHHGRAPPCSRARQVRQLRARRPHRARQPGDRRGDGARRSDRERGAPDAASSCRATRASKRRTRARAS